MMLKTFMGVYGWADSIYTYLEMLFTFPVVSVLGIIRCYAKGMLRGVWCQRRKTEAQVVLDVNK